MRKPSAKDIARFWAKVERGPGCWLWRGATSDGYGQFRIGGRAGRQHGAHRVAWRIARGPIPNGSCVLHRCDTPACVRPAHLFLGTKADNNRDMANKRRHRGSSKLTPAQVAKLRSRWPDEPQRELAAAFGITQSAVSRIVNGHNYRKEP